MIRRISIICICIFFLVMLSIGIGKSQKGNDYNPFNNPPDEIYWSIPRWDW